MKRNFVILNEANHDYTSNNFYVYELIDPSSQQPFYVGKGRDDRAQRHISLRKNKKLQKSNPHKFNTINKIIDIDKKQVIVKLIKSMKTEHNAFIHERSLIKKYGRKCNGSGILTNIASGGKGNTQDGKSIDQFTMWGEYVKTYKNAKEAARVNGWKTYGMICSCCKQQERSYHGFLWAYTGNTPKKLIKVTPVYQWSQDGSLVMIYRNASRAAKALKCDPSTILDCVNGHIRQALGFLWSREPNCPILRANNKKRMVRHLNTTVMYNSVTEAAKSTNHSIGAISACCNGRIQKIGADAFEYIDISH